MQKLWNKRIRSEIKHFLQLLVFMKWAGICNLGNQYSLQYFVTLQSSWELIPSRVLSWSEWADWCRVRRWNHLQEGDKYQSIRHRQFIFPTKSIVLSHIHTSCDATCNNSSCDTPFNFTTKWINNIQINHRQGGDKYLNVKTSFFPQTSN